MAVEALIHPNRILGVLRAATKKGNKPVFKKPPSTPSRTEPAAINKEIYDFHNLNAGLIKNTGKEISLNKRKHFHEEILSLSGYLKGKIPTICLYYRHITHFVTKDDRISQI